MTVRERLVVAIKKEPWLDFVNRRGDWGRDLALYLGRKHGGLTLRELGAQVGMQGLAVSKAVTRLEQRLPTDKKLQRAAACARRMLDGTRANA